MSNKTVSDNSTNSLDRDYLSIEDWEDVLTEDVTADFNNLRMSTSGHHVQGGRGASVDHLQLHGVISDVYLISPTASSNHLSGLFNKTKGVKSLKVFDSVHPDKTRNADHNVTSVTGTSAVLPTSGAVPLCSGDFPSLAENSFDETQCSSMNLNGSVVSFCDSGTKANHTVSSPFMETSSGTKETFGNNSADRIPSTQFQYGASTSSFESHNNVNFLNGSVTSKHSSGQYLNDCTPSNKTSDYSPFSFKVPPQPKGCGGILKKKANIFGPRKTHKAVTPNCRDTFSERAKFPGTSTQHPGISERQSLNSHHERSEIEMKKQRRREQNRRAARRCRERRKLREMTVAQELQKEMMTMNYLESQLQILTSQKHELEMTLTRHGLDLGSRTVWH